MRKSSLTIITILLLLATATTAQAGTTPKFSVIISGANVCQYGALVTFVNTTTTTNNPARLSYYWNFGGWNANPSNWNMHTPPQVQFHTAGTHQVMLQVFDSVTNNYYYYDTSINVYPQPQISLLTIGNGGTLTCAVDSLTASVTTNMTSSVIWQDDSLNIFASGASAIVRKAGQHTVTAITSAGCKSYPNSFWIYKSVSPSVAVGYWGPSGFVGDDSLVMCANTIQQFNPQISGVYPFTFLWNTGSTTTSITPTVSGIYSLQATDVNGCKVTDSAYLTVQPLPSDTITVSKAKPCAGDTVMLSVPTGNKYVWSAWNADTSNSMQILWGGIFSVTITDSNGCSATTSTKNIVFNPLPEPEVQANGCHLAISKITTGSKYLWYFEGISMPNEVNQFTMATNKGYYAVLETTHAGCSAMSKVEFADCTPAGIPNLSGIAGAKIYPSPFVTSFTIATSENKNHTVELFNLSGQKVHSANIYDKGTVHADALPSGMYVLTISDGEHTVRRKIVKE